jgi:hypothetical protein
MAGRASIWHSRRIWLLALALVMLLGSSPAALLAQPATPAAASELGMSRARPVPLGEMIEAGPISLRVEQVLIGPDAVGAILAASPHNVEPRDGFTYVAVNLAVSNSDDVPHWMNNDDFALTGDSGLVRRFLGAQPPEPALNQSVEPGQSASGWVTFGVPATEGSLLLIFDSLELGASWADRVLALQDSAAIPDLAQPVAAVNGDGAEPAAPLGPGTAAITGQWSVELMNVVSGGDAFNLVDYRSGALGVGDANGEDGSLWVALQFRVQNVTAGGQTAYFPANAFTLVDEAGEPLTDVMTLTPPFPDAAGDYYPGAIREGWVMFDVPLEYTASTVRFLPFAHTATSLDPRYFSFG